MSFYGTRPKRGDIMFKKYLIRIIGALCILGAAALMFMPGWIQVEDLDRRELRNYRSDLEGICSEVSDAFVAGLDDEDFKDELKDCDLPYTRSKLKARFKEIEELGSELLNDTVSLQELLVLSVKVPGLLKDAENLLDSNCSSAFFYSYAHYILFEGSNAVLDPYGYDNEIVIDIIDQLEESAQTIVDEVSEYSYVFVLVTGVMILILALAVISAITHVCNKGRWVKYLFLTILVLLVAGTCVALSMASDMLVDALAEVPLFADMSVNMANTPFVAVGVMFIPVVLDIIFERKKKQEAVAQ